MADMFPETLTTFSLDQLIIEAEREATLRRRVYPRWVAAGNLKQTTADARIAMMDNIARILAARKGDNS